MTFFSNESTHAFGQKMPIFSLFKFDQHNSRNNAQCLYREKTNIFDLKKTEKIAFLQRVNSMLLIKKCQFFSLFIIDQNIKDQKKCLVTLQRNKKPSFYFNKPCSLKSKTSHFLLLLLKNANFSFIQIWSKEDQK